MEAKKPGFPRRILAFGLFGKSGLDWLGQNAAGME